MGPVSYTHLDVYKRQVIVTFMNAWNDFQYSLYFITKPVNYTMPQTVYAFKGHYTESLNLLCGDLVLTIVPILIVYLVAQKYIIAVMTAGAVKAVSYTHLCIFGPVCRKYSDIRQWPFVCFR